MPVKGLNERELYVRQLFSQIYTYIYGACASDVKIVGLYFFSKLVA